MKFCGFSRGDYSFAARSVEEVGMEPNNVVTIVIPASYVSFNGLRYWADCARCGIGQLPRTRTITAPRYAGGPRVAQYQPITEAGADVWRIRANRNGKHERALLCVCSGCGDTVPCRITKACTSHADKPLERCGGACLNGKTSCSCRCLGRCHGAGRCVCGDRDAR